MGVTRTRLQRTGTATDSYTFSTAALSPLSSVRIPRSLPRLLLLVLCHSHPIFYPAAEVPREQPAGKDGNESILCNFERAALLSMGAGGEGKRAGNKEDSTGHALLECRKPSLPDSSSTLNRVLCV